MVDGRGADCCLSGFPSGIRASGVGDPGILSPGEYDELPPQYTRNPMRR